MIWFFFKIQNNIVLLVRKLLKLYSLYNFKLINWPELIYSNGVWVGGVVVFFKKLPHLLLKSMYFLLLKIMVCALRWWYLKKKKLPHLPPKHTLNRRPAPRITMIQKILACFTCCPRSPWRHTNMIFAYLHLVRIIELRLLNCLKNHSRSPAYFILGIQFITSKKKKHIKIHHFQFSLFG